MGGGILYNQKVYADLGLSVPTTWAEFAANNEKIKAAGIAPVAATFGDTWTSRCSSSPTTSTSRQRCLTSPRSTRPTGPLRRHPRRAGQLQAPPGGVSTRTGGRRTSPRPSWTAVSRPSPRARRPTTRCSPSCSGRSPRTSRTGQRRRLLRAAGRRRQRRDDLDAGSHVHRRHNGARRRGQGLPRVHRLGRRHRSADLGDRAIGSVRDRRLVTAGRRAARGQGHPDVPRGEPARQRSSSCRRSRGRRSSRSRSPWARVKTAPKRPPRCTTRMWRRQHSSSACRAGISDPSWARSSPAASHLPLERVAAAG